MHINLQDTRVVSVSLTETESIVLSKLVEAWNAFVELPIEHPDGLAEFRHGIHDLQRQIMCRTLLRAYRT